MASGLQLNVFKMFSFLEEISFSFFSLPAALWQKEQEEGGTLNGFAASLG